LDAEKAFERLVLATCSSTAGTRNSRCVARGQALVWPGQGATVGKLSRSHALARGTPFASATPEAEMDVRILKKLIDDPHARRELAGRTTGARSSSAR